MHRSVSPAIIVSKNLLKKKKNKTSTSSKTVKGIKELKVWMSMSGLWDIEKWQVWMMCQCEMNRSTSVCHTSYSWVQRILFLLFCGSVWSKLHIVSEAGCSYVVAQRSESKSSEETSRSMITTWPQSAYQWVNVYRHRWSLSRRSGENPPLVDMCLH